MDNAKVLRTTWSVCPVCLQKIQALYVVRSQEVWLAKSCPLHGEFAVPVWDTVDGFFQWQRPGLEQKPAKPGNKALRGCPYDCGICVFHKQATCCVLLEVTQQCNLSCPICFASSGKGKEPADPELDTIDQCYDMLMEHGGPFNIQLSGGEPTLRNDLPQIIERGKNKGFTFFQLNTNGLRLAEDWEFVKALADAGLNTVFLQFDTLKPQASLRLRGEDLIEKKEKAIQHCVKAGLGVVLVPTLMPGCNDQELGALVEYAAGKMPGVRGVHFQPISYFGRYEGQPDPLKRLTIPKVLKKLEEQTSGNIKAADFLAGGAEHSLCSFHADYLVDGHDWQCTTTEQTGCCCDGRADGEYEAEKPNGCCDTKAEKEDWPKENRLCSSDMARKAVAMKWSAPMPLPEIRFTGKTGYDFSSLDEFLHRKSRYTLAISGMLFQDAWTLDLQRLQRCYIHVVSPENTLIPFCSYNLTAQDGRTIHRR